MKLSTILWSLSFYAATARSVPLATVHTSNGPIFTEARDANGIYSFKSIPYAAPPVGNLRWRPPAQPTPWTNALNTTSFKPTCYMFDAGFPLNIPAVPQSEDCLLANVYTATPNSKAHRPVMVWIHGGGFETDTARRPGYDGTRFAQAGVIFVSIDYRLGNLGFLAHPELDGEGSMSGNFGLLDMIYALDWVKANIESFGGDPNNICIFGESAGAHAIGLLMSSPLARGRFHKAIIESGAWWDSEHGNLEYFDEARRKGTAWAKTVSSQPTLQSLRALSAETIVNSSRWYWNTDPAITAFTPSVDNWVLPSIPATVFQHGLQAHVPLLAGWNREEGLTFAIRSLPKSNPEEFKSNLTAFFDVPGKDKSDTSEKLALYYPARTINETITSANKLIGDLVIAQQTWEAAYLHSCAGNPTYVYHYNYSSAFSPIPQHGSELPFVFGVLGQGPGTVGSPNADDISLSDKIMRYWVNFATSGDPNKPSQQSSVWPRFIVQGTKSPSLMSLNLAVGPDNSFDYGRFEFIRSFRVNGLLPPQWRKW